MALLLGLDVGSTAVKALLYDAERAVVVAIGQAPTPVLESADGRSAFDPEGVWQATVAAIGQTLAMSGGRTVAAIAAASMGEVGVPLDATGTPCYPAITWYDRRTEEQLPWWEEYIGVERVYQITGQVLHHMYSALKLQWLRAHGARSLGWHTALALHGGYVGWRLCGEAVTDQSIASRTLLFDQASAAWCEELLAATGLPRSLFPEVAPSGTAFGKVSAVAAAATGLAEGTPVVTGGHDHLVGALAVGAAHTGVLLDSAGTAEGIMLTADRFDPSPALFAAGFSTYRHVVPGRFVIVAGQHGAGGLITWLIDRLYPPTANGRDYDRALADAAAAPVGAGGLFCLPHLRGSRVPERDLQSRACFVGLVDGHGRGHLVRSALESLGFWLKSSSAVLGAATGLDPAELVVIGGATRSPLWLQIKADVTNRPLRVPAVDEAVALGAALLAGVGAGVYSNADAAAASLTLPVRRVVPNAEAAAQYTRAYAVYRQLYPAVSSVNTAIRALAAGPHALRIL